MVLNIYYVIFEEQLIWDYFIHMNQQLVGYANAGYLSDPHEARSQTGYVFTHGGMAISWRSMKQTIAATSSNHAKILAIH